MEFERDELQIIRERAESAGEKVPSQTWSRAFYALAVAADHLDAMIARCTVPANESAATVVQPAEPTTTEAN